MLFFSFIKLRNNSNMSLLMFCPHFSQQGWAGRCMVSVGGVKRWCCGRDSCTAPCPFSRRTADPPGWCSRPKNRSILSMFSELTASYLRPWCFSSGRRLLTAQTKQVSCHLTPRASRNLSPASMGKSQPLQLVPNMV